MVNLNVLMFLYIYNNDYLIHQIYVNFNGCFLICIYYKIMWQLNLCFLCHLFYIPPNSLIDSIVSLKVKTTKGEGIGVHSLARSILGVEGHVGALGWKLERAISRSIIHTNLHRPNNKLVNVWLKHFWCIDESWAYTNS
jgi:hypothetical protein